MQLLHINYYPSSPEPSTEIRTSKLRMVWAEQDFPWSGTESFVVRRCEDEAQDKFPLQKHECKNKHFRTEMISGWTPYTDLRDNFERCINA